MSLTDREYWDEQWSGLALPAVANRERSPLAASILEFIERHADLRSGQSVIEVGGAPGTYLAALAAGRHLKLATIDYSPIGCASTEENMRLLGLECAVNLRDIWQLDESDRAAHDLVYSLGFIEHFEDVGSVVAQHLELLEPGGVLIVGVPNYRGIYTPWLRRQAPDHLAKHNLEAMDHRQWKRWSEDLGLETIDIRYVGGIEPGYFSHNERGDRPSILAARAARALGGLHRRAPRWLRGPNSPSTGAYLIGAFRR